MGKDKRRLRTITCFSLLVLLLSGTASAAPSLLRVRQAYLDFPSLTVFVDILDSQGNPILPSKDAQLTASLGDAPLAINSWKPFNAEQEGLLIVFLVDTSSSIGSNRFIELQHTLSSWIHRLNPADRASVIAFGDSVSLVQGYTSEKNALFYAIDSLVAEDSHAQFNLGILRALEIARIKNAELPRRRMILLCTDGFREKPGDATAEEVRAALVSDPVPIYSIFFDSTSRESIDRVEEAQQLLNELGYDAGLVDGRLGPRTIAAIRTFQRNRGLPLDGTVSVELLSALRTFSRNQKEKSLSLIGEYSRRSGGETYRLGTSPFSTIFDSIAVSLKNSLVLQIALDNLITDGTVKRLQVSFFDGAVSLSDGIGIRMLGSTPRTITESPLESEKETPWWALLLGVPATGGVLFIIIRERKRLIDLKGNLPHQSANELSDGAPVPMISIELIAKEGSSAITLQAAFSDRLRLGRNSGPTSLAIHGDDTVSGRHCEFLFSEGRLFVRDLSSSNGTVVNGVKIQGNHPLEDGDRLAVGKTEFRVRILAVYKARNAFLVGISGPYKGRSLPIPADGLLIGRDPSSCSLVIQSPLVSRRHIRLSRGSSPYSWILEDLNSTNGTFVMDGSTWVRVTGAYRFSLSYGSQSSETSLASKRFRLGDENNEFEIRQGGEG